MKSVFISYRRSDSADISGRIADRLKQRFGKDDVFFDVDAAPDGMDFSAYHESIIKRAKVTLVIIGPDWLHATSGWLRGERLRNRRDRVRIEILTALEAKTKIIPILVRGAAMPDARHLPKSLRPLAERTALTVRSDGGFDGDMNKVIEAIEPLLKAPAPRATSGPRPRSGGTIALIVTLALVVIGLGVYAVVTGSPPAAQIMSEATATPIPTPTPTFAPPPVATFTDTESGSYWGGTCTMNFDASRTESLGTITSYSWNFGDNSPDDTEAVPTVSHQYASGNTYTVTLEVTDNDGQGGTVTQSVSFWDFLWC